MPTDLTTRHGAHPDVVAGEERRQRILDAATVLFRERPYDGVSLDEVAEAAGVARGLISHYFGTKRGLYIEVVRWVTGVESFPIPEYVRGATPLQRLAESLDGWLEGIERNRDLWLDSYRAASSMGDAEIAELIEKVREDTALRLVAVLGLGPADSLAPEMRGLARAWTGFGEAAVLQWLIYERLTRGQVRELFLETVSHGVGRLVEPHDSDTQ